MPMSVQCVPVRAIVERFDCASNNLLDGDTQTSRPFTAAWGCSEQSVKGLPRQSYNADLPAQVVDIVHCCILPS